jgi:hypothetical protein
MNNDFFNVPELQIDLSQAHSLRVEDQMGRAESTANPHITQFRNVLEEVIGGLTSATQKALESQHHYFETVIKELETTLQSALNDIDGRLNAMSQQQAQSDEALDAFIKIFMLGGNKELNLEDQTKIVTAFLKRGLPPAPAVEDTTALLTSILAEKPSDQAATVNAEA